MRFQAFFGRVVHVVPRVHESANPKFFEANSPEFHGPSLLNVEHLVPLKNRGFPGLDAENSKRSQNKRCLHDLPRSNSRFSSKVAAEKKSLRI